VALVEDTRDIKLLIEVKSCLRLVSYAPGRIELEPTENAPRDLINRLKRTLQEATGVTSWVLRRHRRRADDHGGRGHREGRTDGRGGTAPADAGHPRRLSRGAKIEQIRTRAEITRPQAEALPEMPDEDDTPEDWDPFED
jgi:DNA polymerase-3 subunit gamma/tau